MSLFCIVTGIVHSGTSVMSQFIMSDPNLFGAFECGMLLAPKPPLFKNVSPFYSWMIEPVSPNRRWGVAPEDMEKILSCESHEAMYDELYSASPLLKGTRYQIVDKTPHYLNCLCDVMARMPDVPVIVTRKHHRTKHGRDRVLTRKLNAVTLGYIKKATNLFPGRVLVVRQEALANDPSRVMRQVFDFLGLEWRDEYFSMEAYNSKWDCFLPLSPALPFDPYRCLYSKKQIDDGGAFRRGL